MKNKERSSQASQAFDITVEYAPNLERMLEALMLALGLPSAEIKSMLAARREQKRDENLDGSNGIS